MDEEKRKNLWLAASKKFEKPDDEITPADLGHPATDTPPLRVKRRPRWWYFLAARPARRRRDE